LGLILGTQVQKEILRVIPLEQLKALNSVPSGKDRPSLIQFGQSKALLSNVSFITL